MQLTNLRTSHALAALAVAAVAAAATVAQTTAPASASRPTTGDPGPSPTLGAKPPALAAGGETLFDGGTWARWHRRDGAPSEWMPLPDGSVQVRGGDAITDDTFTDFQLHLEFFLPDMGEKTGQARANSGVYLHGRYEVQVLDTYGIEPAMGGCGAIYSISPPMVTANRPADTWQTYDIIFRAPRFDGDGRLTDNPFATVLHNGVVIHNNLELPHTTPGGIDEQMVASGPLLLQDHGDPIRYRNIWIRRLD